MKKFIAVMFFIALVIGSGIYESQFIAKTFNTLESQLEHALELLEVDKENINTEKNINYMTAVHKDWQKKTKVLKFFVWHTGIKEMEIGLARITSYIVENDYKEAYVELNTLIDYSEHYKEDYRFSVQNIF